MVTSILGFELPTDNFFWFSTIRVDDDFRSYQARACMIPGRLIEEATCREVTRSVSEGVVTVCPR